MNETRLVPFRNQAYRVAAVRRCANSNVWAVAASCLERLDIRIFFVDAPALAQVGQVCDLSHFERHEIEPTRDDLMGWVA